MPPEPLPIGVVEVDRGEHRHIPVRRVRGVPRPAHPDLEHQHVDRGVGERDEGQCGQQLEERQGLFARLDELRVHQPDERGHLVPRVGDGRIEHREPVDHDAFREALEVRAREKSRAQPVGAQQALDDAARARLAVGARDADKN